jgi:membrane protein required for colicin V production
MNELDYAICVLLAASLLIGIYRGAVREVFNIAGWILAFILAHAFAPHVATLFADWMTEPVIKQIVAWLIIFLSVIVIVALIASLASELVRKLGLSTLDRVLGALIGLVRGFVVIVALALAAGLTKIPQTPVWRSAAATPWLEVAALYARGILPDNIASRIKYRPAATQST